MSSHTAAKAAQATNRVIAVNKKYTVQSTGIWERLRRLLAVDPSRSNGVPLNPQFRNPPPGSNAPFSFLDPVTIPAGDIAENPYWKRDARRSYPQLSTVTQGDAVGLLALGSRNAPKKELIGEAGSKELVSVKEEGEKGLSAYFGKVGKEGTLAALGKDGLPPLPSGASLREGADKYHLTAGNAYPEQYPCRTFQ
ncbi:NADH-ubiquinone oxidoreductase 21.3 kDa subunit [Acephala macrosclerotiorum]|nr:NADH-ubiquinone oxidoreductase 21.3 kDa subunit [Acephala macrosclerotiorum]